MPTEVLLVLADRTASAPEPPGSGRYHYLRTSGWHRQAGSPGPDARTEPFDREDWCAADGSGRLLVTRDGQAVPPSGDFPPGGLVGDFLASAEPSEAIAHLRRYQGARGVVGWFLHVWRTQVVPPALQRTLLRHLAAQPELTIESAGAEVVVRCPHPQRPVVRHLVFDGGTGMLREERNLTADGTTVTGCTRWHESGYVDTTDSRP